MRCLQLAAPLTRTIRANLLNGPSMCVEFKFKVILKWVNEFEFDRSIQYYTRLISLLNIFFYRSFSVSLLQDKRK